MDEKTLSLESRVLAFVAWALNIVGAIIALLVATDSSKYVKQHAIQSFIFYIICAILAVLIKVASIFRLPAPCSLAESVLYFTSFRSRACACS
ncbi:MAG: hypothetical protein DRN04_05805 [Thermoprotei archaeon]|nr:MAG: hypothetical protein DRN04_05805 [Thermoprotei archaeon]